MTHRSKGPGHITPFPQVPFRDTLFLMSGNPEPPRSSPALPLLLLAASGTAAYFFIYEPERRKRLAAEEMARLIAERQRQTGMSAQDAFQSLGTAACQVIAMKYMLPPQATAGMCSLAVSLAPKALLATAKLTGKAVHGIGTGIGAGAKAAATGTASAVKTIAMLPANIAKDAVLKPIASAGKKVGNFFKKLF
jgi:hypothetical protein